MEWLTIKQVQNGLQNKDFSCTELTNFYLQKIDQQKNLNAFVSTAPASALAQARSVDEKISRREILSGLEGTPGSIKDLILVKGLRATAGSKILENYQAAYDATVVDRLKKSGMIILGKNNCDEFAMGSSNETSAWGPTLNPWNITKVPGGSSGGSAAAVAADLGVFSLGTDTGGSIRQPASFCGVVGLKPTYGRVSRFGLMAMTSSLDQAGPLTRSVEDAAIIFQVISGTDDYDATCVSRDHEDYSANLAKPIKGLRLGLPKEYWQTGLNAEVKTILEQAVNKYRELGAEIVEVDLPHTAYALAVYYIIMPAEVSSNLARFDGIRYGRSSQTAKNLWEVYAQSRAEGFGSEAKRRIMMGTYVLSAGYQNQYYLQARKVQKVIEQEYAEVFKKVDALLTPTSPTSAFGLGEKVNDPLTMYLSDIYTVSANIAGLCGISIPAGLTAGRLPVGLQILGAPWTESKILNLAYQFEQATIHHSQHP
ncbi:MAG: Asp-tRNA(Asn)/Glu-tRNA(Gln) amidotransferase subunit GatA [Candidatus Komeilibacteria bacterium]|nr:Asp-tRNA(Asn)/Glu-tRNA(Gln) amidotransferase subunit GatA [Candidatus Komeilibacteria bacterium]